MNSAETLVLDRSHTYLTSVGLTVEAVLSGRGARNMTSEDAFQLGVAQFDAIGELLRACIDFDDDVTFTEVERQWSAMFDDVWLPGFPGDAFGDGEGFSEATGGRPREEVVALIRKREILRFGLAMWAIHRLRAVGQSDEEDGLRTVLATLSSQYETIEYVLDARDAADGADDRDRTPFTRWFLSELPSAQAHFIPTSDELLFAALVLSVRLISPDETATLRPRPWFIHRKEDIDRHLAAIVEHAERWQRLLGLVVPPGTEIAAPPPPGEAIRSRVVQLRSALDVGAVAQQAADEALTRALALDPSRIDVVRREAIRRASEDRIVRDTFKWQGGLATFASEPDGPPALVSATWVPKRLFTVGSEIIGLDMVGRDLGLSARHAERKQLREALPEPSEQSLDGDFSAAVSTAIARMRDAGLQPTLVLLPTSWHVREALGLRAVGRVEVDHARVPPRHRRAFAGVVDEVPAIDIGGTPPEHVWIVDLPRALRFVEWPSEEDSGIRFKVESFDEESAAQFIQSHPTVLGDRSADDVVSDLQTQLRITLSLCWRIEPVDAAAAVSVRVPAELTPQS